MSDRRSGSLLLEWWREADDYQWRIDFLRSRGLLTTLRYLIAGIGATLGILALWNAIASPLGIGGWLRIGWAIVGVGSLGWAVRWAFLPWPSARESAALVGMVDVMMTLSALLWGDPYVAMSGIPLLLCAGAYVVFFHGPRLHVAHILWCVASVLGIAVWLGANAPEGGLLVAASRSVIALLVTVCVLPILQFGFWLLQDSSMQSLTDPLTELTNRRGLGVSLQRLDAAQATRAPVCAILIDVDGFKAINDTRGHAVGDDVLIRTAQRIRASVRREAVVVRWGGEEFLVVDRIAAGEAFAIAERIRHEVAQPADPSRHRQCRHRLRGRR